ncbi:hypothetical protein GGI07_003014 [Coemansia sp. Benny D115]|nr:hypothetical protein GGI07_003014 [Coemansia sp. Benny D115]
MLKAFSKVFHKTSPQHGTSEEPVKAGSTPGLGVDGGAVLSRGGLELGGGPGSPRRRNAGEENQQPSRQAIEPSRRMSLQRRVEQQMQPRLHVKSPAPGVDGRFALTSDNIEWHLRMIPPMKESKYERILKYVQMQQQQVSAAADPSAQQQLRDIDTSLLMGGQMSYEYGMPVPGMEYMDSPFNSVEKQLAAQQQQQFYQQQQQQQQMAQAGVIRPAYGAPAAVPIIVASGAAHAHPLAAENEFGSSRPAFQSAGNQPAPVAPPQEIRIDTTRAAMDGAAATQPISANNSPAAAHDNEEDDNTPLAAINVASTRPQPPAPLSLQPNSLTAQPGSQNLLEKCMKEPLDGPLPDPVSPNHAARMSMMSFGSNMAVQLNSEAQAVSRSHSLSNPHSASAYGSHYRATPVARSPTVHDGGAQHMSTHSGSARQSSFPSAQVNMRPSMDALGTFARDRGLSNANSDGDGQQLLAALAIRQSSTEQQQQQQLQARISASDPVKSQGDDDDDDDDNLPLMQPLTFKDSENKGMVLSTKLQPPQPQSLQPLQLPEMLSIKDYDSARGSRSSGALRVVNQANSSRESDESADEEDICVQNDDTLAVVPAATGGEGLDGDLEDEDDQPLMRLSRKLSAPQQPTAVASLQPSGLYINTNAAQLANGLHRALGDPVGDNDDDDDDDQPLSGLLLQQPPSASDDLGSLPLPMPRRVVDPDAVANMDEMINEVILPARSSMSDNSPVSPVMAPRGAVRKHSLLLHSSKPGGRADGESRGEEGTEDGAERRSVLELSGGVGYRTSMTLNRRRSNVSAFAQGLVIGPDDVPSASSSSSDAMDDDNRPIALNAAETRRIHELNGWDNTKQSPDRANIAAGATGTAYDAGGFEMNSNDLGLLSGDASRPWAGKQRTFSSSTSSLNNAKRSQRGSTLGQQLSDELNRLRERLARGRRENEKGERRSWQVGDAAERQQSPLTQQLQQQPHQQPWMVQHPENSMSESALPTVSTSDPNGTGGRVTTLADVAAMLSDEEAGNLGQSTWSYAGDKPRPMSTQYRRATSWFTRGRNPGDGDTPGESPTNDSSGRFFGSRSNLPPLRLSKDNVSDVQLFSTSPQSTKSLSLSSRINMRLGRLKRTFKHNDGTL